MLISGYLAAKSLQNNQAGTIKYYVSRFWRIVPTYWIVVCFDILIKVFVMHSAKLADIRWVRYIFFVQMFIPSDDFYTWNNMFALWTMSAFALCYLLAPSIKRISGTNKSATIFLVLSLFGGLLVNRGINAFLDAESYDMSTQFSTWFPVCQIFIFVCGMWYEKVECIDRRWPICICLAGCVSMLRVNLMYSCAFAGVLLLIVLKRFERRDLLPKSKLIQRFNNISYEVYLIHMSLIWIICRITVDTSIIPMVKAFICTVVALVGAILLKCISKVLINNLIELTQKLYKQDISAH